MPWSEWAHLNFHRLWWFLTLWFGTLLLHLNGHYVHIQVARTIHCISTNLAEMQLGRKVGEVWTAWLHLLIQNQVVEPHNKKSNQNKPRIFGVILIWFLSRGCTTWFCIKRFIHIVNTSPTFPQNVHIHVAQTRYCKPTKISSLSGQRYNFCKFAICNYLVAVQSGLAFKD